MDWLLAQPLWCWPAWYSELHSIPLSNAGHHITVANSNLVFSSTEVDALLSQVKRPCPSFEYKRCACVCRHGCRTPQDGCCSMAVPGTRRKPLLYVPAASMALTPKPSARSSLPYSAPSWKLSHRTILVRCMQFTPCSSL